MQGIYLITNKINGKQYVGSSTNMEQRKKAHILASRSKPKRPLYLEIHKYGINNFEFKTLEIVEDWSDLWVKELFWFEKIKPKYNIRKPVPNPSHNPKYRLIKKEIYKTEEFKKLRSDISKLQWIKNRDKYMKSAKVVGEILRIKYQSAEFRKNFTEIWDAKKIKCNMVDVKTGKILKHFDSYTEGAIWIVNNTSYKSSVITAVNKIRAVAENKRKVAYGYNWQKV